jgi:hypothetical protein
MQLQQEQGTASAKPTEEAAYLLSLTPALWASRLMRTRATAKIKKKIPQQVATSCQYTRVLLHLGKVTVVK